MGEKVVLMKSLYMPQIVSLAVAFMLWMYVQNSEQIDINRKIPVHVLLPDDIGMVSRPPQEITVRLRGARSSLRNIRPDTEHFINLKGMGIKGRKSLMVPIRTEELPVQHFGIKIVDYSPKEVTVDMDVLVVRQIPVKAALIGEMAGGAALLSQMVTPSHINVKGAKEYLKSITHISTRPIDLTTVTGPGEWKVPIEIDDQRIILDDATAKEVSVKLDIVAAKMERRNFDIPIRFISNGQNFHTNTQNVTVNYSYPNSLSAEDMEKGIRALVEVPEKSGVHKINVTVNLPEGLQLNKVYPDVITVKIDKRSSKR